MTVMVLTILLHLMMIVAVVDVVVVIVWWCGCTESGLWQWRLQELNKADSWIN